MDDKTLWALAAFFLGVMIARNGNAPASATNTQVHNETSATGQWWSYAGMWS